jgi:hypothetical protein
MPIRPAASSRPRMEIRRSGAYIPDRESARLALGSHLPFLRVAE